MENKEFGPVFEYFTKNNSIKIVLTMLLLSLCPLALAGWPVFSFYSIENEEFGPAFEWSESLRSFLQIPHCALLKVAKKVLKPFQCLHVLYVSSLKCVRVLEHVDHVDFLLVTSLFAAEVRFFHVSLTSEVVLFSTATAFTAAVISAQNFIFLGVCHTVCEFGL